MINFVVVEDNKTLNNIICHEIDKALFQIDDEYKIHKFLDFDKNFHKLTKKELPFRIYILDIHTPSRSGIDVAREIRERDTKSIIIFLTSHEKFGTILLKDEINFLAFIVKTEFTKRLPIVIKKALKIFGKQQVLAFKDQKVKYTIPMNSIIYITTNTLKKKTVIITNYSSFEIGKPMKDVEKMLPPNFVRSHRACIVNCDHIVAIDKRQHIIEFDNGTRTGLMNSVFAKKFY